MYFFFFFFYFHCPTQLLHFGFFFLTTCSTCVPSVGVAVVTCCTSTPVTTEFSSFAEPLIFDPFGLEVRFCLSERVAFPSWSSCSSLDDGLFCVGVIGLPSLISSTISSASFDKSPSGRNGLSQPLSVLQTKINDEVDQYSVICGEVDYLYTIA